MALTGGWAGEARYGKVSGARPRKAIDRSEPLGHDAETKYEADLRDGLRRFDEFAKGLGWAGVEELAEQSVQTIGGVFGDFVMKAFDDDETRGDTAFALLGFRRRYWWLKVATTLAWRLLKEWQL